MTTEALEHAALSASRDAIFEAAYGSAAAKRRDEKRMALAILEWAKARGA